MPGVFIEAPPGIKPEAKKQMAQKITTAIDEAYHISDVLIRAAIAAYAERAGVTVEEFARRLSPHLTPAIMGDAVVELYCNPTRWDKLAYQIGGGGLKPLN